jgi:hypothetical protein
MGYFDGLTDASFKMDDKGNTIYYPWGIFGKGYILPDDRKTVFRLSIKRHIISFLTLAILSAIFLKGSLVIFYVLPFYIVGYVLWMKKKIKGLPISPDKLTFADTTTNSARSLNLVTLWLLEICALLFVLLGIFVLLTTPITFPKKWFIGLSCILFFGWGMYVFGKVIMAKKRQKS